MHPALDLHKLVFQIAQNGLVKAFGTPIHSCKGRKCVNFANLIYKNYRLYSIRYIFALETFFKLIRKDLENCTSALETIFGV
jgi:hypothetical protein